MSKHCHHSCEHKEVKFCKDCNKVYCSGCKEEWEASCRLSHYPWTLTSQQITPRYPFDVWYLTSGSKTTLDGPSKTVTADEAAALCSHL
jgi:hypothetical protein